MSTTLPYPFTKRIPLLELLRPRRYGHIAVLLCALLAVQGAATVESLTQWLQLHVLRLSLDASTGLVDTTANEWAPFAWSVGFLLLFAYLAARGVRGPWAWALLVWAGAHALEHTYLLARYLQVAQELRALGAGDVPVQDLAGIFGQDGWLARSAATRGTLLSRLPALTTATRVDVHFWWTVGTGVLLLPAANTYMARLLGREKA